MPPPTGRIYFLWDPLSRPDDLPDPVHNLYVAIPGETANDWEIETVLTELVGIPVIALSPDKTKLAFTALEDANNDGSVSFQGSAHYLDIPNVFVYSLTDNELERITDNYPWVRNLTWSNDSQRLAYQSGTDVYVATHPITGEPELVHSFPGEVQELAWSPDGNYLAIGIFGSEFYLLDVRTNLLTKENIGQQVSNLAWSPNSQWLTSNEFISRGLFLIDASTFLKISLVQYPAFSQFAWSPDQHYLAFTDETRYEGSMLASSFLSIWDTESRETKVLAETGRIFNVLWSTNSQSLAIGVLHEDRGELVQFDLLSNQSSVLFEISGITEVRPLGWSPDGQWLLFYSRNNNESSLSLIHQTGGEVFQLVDTTNTYMPYGVFWLSD